MKRELAQVFIFFPLLVLIYVWMAFYEIYYGKKLTTKPGMACECQ